MSDFVPLEGVSMGLPADESVQGSSDLEQTSSYWEDEGAGAIDYWFGKKYFHCVVAQDLILQEPTQHSMARIDTMFIASLQSFPRRKCLDSLRSEGILSKEVQRAADDRDVHEQLMTAIGKTIRAGTAREKRELLAILHAESSSPPAILR
ncbi:hypothetical protein LTR47_011875, partial [Exophiala xenobiotica]